MSSERLCLVTLGRTFTTVGACRRVALTSTSARETIFRPSVVIADRETHVMCDQLATVDLQRLTETASSLSTEEMRRVDQALALVLDL